MKRGEVRWYRFQNPDKKRPVLILTRDTIIGHLNEVTIAPVTRTIRSIPTEVVLAESDGVPTPCAVNCDHLQTVSKGKIGVIITTLSAEKMAEVGPAVRFALGFS
jgi:mRNA interferase MazF